MAHETRLFPTRTYKTYANAVKSVPDTISDDCRYFINIDDSTGVNRYYVVFVGVSAIEHGMHFKFNVIA